MDVAKQKLQEATALQGTDLEAAVEVFARALQACVEVNGDLSPVCAEYYLRYGMALFELTQNNTTVLGEKATESAETVKVPVTAAAVGSGVHVKPLGVDDDTSKADKQDDEACDTETQGDGGDSGDDDADDDGEGEGSDGDEDADDENEQNGVEGDVQIAWELLDTARVIYEGMESPEALLQLAEVYLGLGDVNQLKDDFNTALKEYRSCISTLEKLEPAATRRLCEAHYKLSLCLLMADFLPEALKHCNTAVELLAARQMELEDQLTQQQPAQQTGDNAADTNGKTSESTSSPTDLEAVKKELVDLEGVMKELKDQALDIKESMEKREYTKAAIRSALTHAMRGDPATASQQPGQTSGQTSTKPTIPKPQPQVLGVVGRGKGRITLAPATANAGGKSSDPKLTDASSGAVKLSAASSGAPLVLPKGKRSLEDLMSGGPTGVASTGTEPAKQAKTSSW